MQVEKENEANVQAEMERSKTRREQLWQKRTELQAKLHDDSVAHEQAIKNLLVLQQKEIRKLNQEFEKQSNQLANRYQAKLAQLKDDLELQRKVYYKSCQKIILKVFQMEIHEVEERKNLHINDLMQNHEKSFNEMRNYYNSITRDNLALINSLKEELADLKSKAVVNERTVEEIELKNKFENCLFPKFPISA
jgi:growth arrest-specific protein 8